MTYRRLKAALFVALVAVAVATGCGRSDLNQYIYGDGSVDGHGDSGACDATTCPTGCCDGTGTCRDGTELNTCGFGGGACNDCLSQGFDFCDAQVKACGNIQPTCDVTSCANGCCTLFNGQQACVSGASSLACGNSGNKCTDCTTGGQVCDPAAKACVNAPCGPNNCKGCCNGTACVGAETDSQCGTGGLSCTDCTSLQEFCDTSTGLCVSVQPTCNASTCAKGCCAGNTCVTSETDTQCGIGGTACADCTSKSGTCSGGTCATACNSKTCPGCCQAGTCFAGFVDSRCGSDGSTCVDCTSSSTTCDTLSVPRVCKGTTTTCPAPYTSCPSTVTTPTLSVTKGSCASTDLADAKAACTTGFGSSSCSLFFTDEPLINAKCATCLASFQYALQDGQGIFNCVSPFVTSTCNHTTGCVDDCELQSCVKCPSSSVPTCRNSVASGQCQPYITSATCIGTALLGTASFCNPTTYSGNYGSWLAGVGAHYCQ